MYNNFSSKKTKKVISALLASALVVTSAPITADAATTQVVGAKKTITTARLSKSTSAKPKITGLSSAEKKIVKLTRKVVKKGSKKGTYYTIKGLKAGSASFKIGSKSYKVKVVSISSMKKKTFATSLTAKKDKAVSVAVSGTNAKYDTFTWTSSNKKVVTVSKASAKMDSKTKLVKNTLKPVAKGTATITVKSKATGKKLAVKVNVAAASTATPAPSASTSATPSVAPSTTPEATASATPATTPGVSAEPSAEPSATPSVEPTTAPAVKAELEKAFTNGANKVQVDFTNKIQAPKAENFKIEGVTIESAELTDDAKSVILTTSTLTADKEYTLTTTGIVDANNEAVADGTYKFTAEKVAYEVKMELGANELKADGQATTQVKVTLYDEKGNIVKDKAEVKFDTTAGSFAETRVTVQNGVATNMFTSEISTTVKEAYITATVVSADNKDLLNITTSRTIKLNPNANTEADQTVGASLTDVVVETCDRVILYFNKDVTVTDYTKGTTTDKYGYDSTKLSVKILDNAKSNENAIPTTTDSRVKTPVALAEVPGNTKALYALLPDGDALTDNAKTVVEVADKTKSVEVKDVKSTLVSDIRVPSMLAVENNGLKEIKVIFSEPIQKGANNTYSAEKLEKWVIDGTALDNEKWGTETASGAAAKVTVGSFNTKTGEDSRNVATITLGKDSKGKQIYFKSGKHSVQGNKIGDYANLSDTRNNIINTQTLDFEIEASTEAPTATVKEESPEQFSLVFNTPVSIEDVKANLKLQKYESGQWTNVSGVNLVVSSADDNGKEYVVELDTDWTKILKTKETTENYYNFDFRLHIDKDKIENSLNGLTNAEINLALADETIMKNPDVTSPKIKDVEQNGTENIIVTMSEPVQIPNLDSETITESQSQNGVPKVTVSFISADNKKTISGKITGMVDAHDTAFTVVPEKVLTAGKWKVVVRSISDDVGNTAETLVKEDFEIKGEVVTEDTSFNVRWIVAVKAGETNPINNKTAEEDMVYIKFNQNFKTYDGAANAGSTTNYTVNGIAVPTTAKIDTSLVNYNEKANVKNNYTDLVAIHLGKDKLNDKSNTVNISATIESVANVKLGNGGMKVLDKYGDGDGVFAWNYKDYNETVTDAKATLYQSVLDNAEYENYDLTKITLATGETTADKSLTVSHTGAVDFGSLTFKELTINTKETGKITINGGKFNIINVNAPNADVVISGTTVSKDTTITDSGVINVQDVMDGTLTLKDTKAEKVVVTDTNKGCAVATTGNTEVKEIVADVAAPLTLVLKSNKENPKVIVNEAAALAIKSDKEVNVEVKKSVAENVEIKSDGAGQVIVKDETGADSKVDVTTGSAIDVTPDEPDNGGNSGNTGDSGNETDTPTKTTVSGGAIASEETVKSVSASAITVDSNGAYTVTATAGAIFTVTSSAVSSIKVSSGDAIIVTNAAVNSTFDVAVSSGAIVGETYTVTLTPDDATKYEGNVVLKITIADKKSDLTSVD